VNILLANHQLWAYAGTEVFVYTLAKRLKKIGHNVFVYSPYVGKVRENFEAEGILICDNLDFIQDEINIAHVHHNIIAYEIRNHFPGLPMVFMSHGVSPLLEQPPLMNLEISQYLAISEAVKMNLINSGIPEYKIDIIRNPIDEEKFFPKSIINKTPKRALIISNKIDNETEEIIQRACKSLSIKPRFVGIRYGMLPNDKMPELIREHDLVLTLGRGVVEAMFCGRIPIVMDTGVGDGMVTPENFSELMQYHFSGRVHWKNYSVLSLVEEIQKYQQENGEKLRRLALEKFSVNNQTEKLEKIYYACTQETINEINEDDKKFIEYYCKAIQETRLTSKNIAQQEFYSSIGGVELYRILRIFGMLRSKIVPKGGKLERLLKRWLRFSKN
jgi:glycosyltransferase involved in cell wall biosynthesis